MANGGSKLMSKKAWKTMHSKPKKSVFSDTPGKVYLGRYVFILKLPYFIIEDKKWPRFPPFNGETI